VPPELVPSGQRLEVRPLGLARPYVGGHRAELLAWLRLTEDDAPPDDERTVVLMDSLAESYAALLEAPLPIPTVTFSVTTGCTSRLPSSCASSGETVRQPSATTSMTSASCRAITSKPRWATPPSTSRSVCSTNPIAWSFAERGRHARSAISVVQCPFGACVEIDLLAELEL
jgi:hypothetical protein